MSEPRIPDKVSTWIDQKGWGTHHQLWHWERMWDHFLKKNNGDPNIGELKWIIANGGARAAHQRGAADSGLELLAMHRRMLQALRTTFPEYASLWRGWAQVPTDPDAPPDPSDVMPQNKITRPFNPDMLRALKNLTDNLASFRDDDELGRYIESIYRVTSPADPDAMSPDPSAGIHWYLHTRFAVSAEDPDAALSMSDFAGNIKNQRFWRLHGWIDNVWSAYRHQKGLSDNDPAYQAALKAQMDPTKDMSRGCGMPGMNHSRNSSRGKAR